MPTSKHILDGLTLIANDAFLLAVGTHVVIALVVLALVLGWRPSRRLAGALLVVPAISAAALAFAYGNPFNGTVFGLLSTTLLVVALRLGTEPVRMARGVPLAVGVALVLFGWAYPHFLEGRSVAAYLYGAPTALVPCPTLSLMVGFALIARGLASRTWSSILGATAVFYGAFGAGRLGVTIDLALLAGGLYLTAWSVLQRTQEREFQPWHSGRITSAR